MQVAKAVTVKVSKKINRDKFLAIRSFLGNYQAIARVYYSYILEHSLQEQLINDEITAADLKNIVRALNKRTLISFNGVKRYRFRRVREKI